MKNKGFTLVELLSVIVVICVIGGIATTIVVGYINSANKDMLENQKNSIISAAKDWAVKNTSKLDEYHLNDTYVSIFDLKSEGFLENKTINNPVTKKIMDGCVVISYVNSSKSYSYEYKEDSCKNLSDGLVLKTPGSMIVLDIEEGKASSSLIKYDDMYVFKGSNPDNYIKIDNNMWRILSIDKDNLSIKVVKVTPLNKAWNENTSVSNLSFMESTIRENIKNDSSIVTDKLRNNFISNSLWYTGNVNLESGNIDMLKSIEKQASLNTDIGLLSISDYANASSSIDCFNNFKSTSCANNNYLNFNSDYWLINSDFYTLWKVNSNGKVESHSNHQLLLNVYPVAYLDYSVQLTGEGTSSNPYIVN